MRVKRKNTFWTFCFSFIPGCAEMYWGFMRAGMSLLVTFTGILFVASVLELPELTIFGMVVYVYAFFHARNMAHMTDEELSVAKDGRVSVLEGFHIPFDRIKRYHAARWGGVLMILYGAYLLLELSYRNISLPEFINYQLQRFLHSFPQLVIAVLLIVLGCRLIMGKKRELEEEGLAERAQDVLSLSGRETEERDGAA
ncbi:MAG: hypothetical protein IJ733_05145, partial [Lachnospiraceae bacterium]|nr:hypothetical protein [Lachnospiraceae bacterium]